MIYIFVIRVEQVRFFEFPQQLQTYDEAIMFQLSQYLRYCGTDLATWLYWWMGAILLQAS